jgi:hypothetical protein
LRRSVSSAIQRSGCWQSISVRDRKFGYSERFVSQQIDIEAAEAFVRRSGMSAAFSAAGSK